MTDSSIISASAPALKQKTFACLGLHTSITDALGKVGYDSPTPVQQRAIPAALKGRDLMVSSPTGSGKTAAFMLPTIHQLTLSEIERSAADAQPSQGRSNDRRRQVAQPHMLVLTPTRELALQVTTAAQTYGRHLRRLKTVSILGGMPYNKQMELLSQRPEILVATPGRLLDHLNRKNIDLSRLSILVLDEADRMLDMGFIDDIESIIATTPATRQTLLFSATLDGKMAIMQRLLNNPERIEIMATVERRDNIQQKLHYVDDRDHKDRLLNHLLTEQTLNQAIIFTATKRDAEQLATSLSQAGHRSAALHGDMPQGARNRTLRALREEKVRVLVATDVAARGIDVPGITHVFNYDLPKFVEDYVHRIGRTGRAGRTGSAISLAKMDEVGLVKRIERYTKQTLAISTVDGFEPRRTPSTNHEERRKPGNRSFSKKTFGATKSFGAPKVGYRSQGTSRPTSRAK